MIEKLSCLLPSLWYTRVCCSKFWVIFQRKLVCRRRFDEQPQIWVNKPWTFSAVKQSESKSPRLHIQDRCFNDIHYHIITNFIQIIEYLLPVSKRLKKRSILVTGLFSIGSRVLKPQIFNNEEAKSHLLQWSQISVRHKHYA